MAVKKATAKKSVTKKAVAKKSTRKKTAPKATTAKKTAVKKTAVKKTAVKKTAVKKTAVKKTAKKAVKRTAAKKSVEAFVIPEAPIAAQRSGRVEIVSTPAPAFVTSTTSATTPASAGKVPAPGKKPGASGRVVFAVAVGIILLGLIVWAKGHNTNSDVKASPTPTATATPTDTASPTPSASDTSAIITAHAAPQGVVAQYTSTGATIFWKAPTAVDGLSGYNVEISVSNGPWKLISTVPAAQLSLDVKKVGTAGWTSFKVASVYTDSQTVAAKAFGLPGTYS